MGIREMSVEAEQGIGADPELADQSAPTYGLGEPAGAASADALGRPIVDTAIPYDAVWDCVTCGACVEACPVLIEHVDKIVGLRRNLVLEESRFPAELTGGVPAMERQGNPWGQPPTCAPRLDEGPAVRGAHGRRGRRRRRAGRRGEARRPLLGRLRGRVRRPQPARSPGRS